MNLIKVCFKKVFRFKCHYLINDQIWLFWKSNKSAIFLFRYLIRFLKKTSSWKIVLQGALFWYRLLKKAQRKIRMEKSNFLLKAPIIIIFTPLESLYIDPKENYIFCVIISNSWDIGKKSMSLTFGIITQDLHKIIFEPIYFWNQLRFSFFNDI